MHSQQDVGNDANIEKMALDHPKTKQFTEGKTIRKVIVVAGRLVNIVAN